MLALPLVQLSLLLRGAPQVGHRCGGPVCVAASPQVESFPLHEEAAAGDANGVELLLLSGIASDARNALSSTPLHLAAVHGHSAVATTLLDHGASINAVNEDGNTPLHAAVGRGNLELAQLLLSRGADPEVKSSSTGMQPLRIAVQKGDAAMVSALVAAGAVMDEETVHDAFWTAVQLVEEKPEDVPLSDAVPGLLRHVFDADIRLLLSRESVTTNVTCLQPAEDAPKTRADDDPGYGVIDDELVAVPLREGRVCDGGTCCDACSRVHYSQFATVAESDAFLSELQFAITPPLHQFSLQKCAFRDQRTTLIFIRLVERMRRAIAHEYGLALSSITPLQTFVSCFIGAQDKQGGLHSDESTFKEFHYSCVLYLSTQGLDFEGGTFSFNDAPAQPADPRVLTPLAPAKGSAVIFSSGWENMHEVEPLRDGQRFAVPCFFTTCPQPEASPHDAPMDDRGRAAELWRTLLAPKEVADFRQFVMSWHALLAAE